jgi:hypothetical protein
LVLVTSYIVHKVTAEVVSWFRWLVAGITPRIPLFDSKQVHVRFVIGLIVRQVSNIVPEGRTH